MHARRENVQTIRQPSYTALLVDSMDRYPSGFAEDVTTQTSSSQWTLQSQQYVLNGYFTRLAVTQIQFFWNLPTIIGGYNNMWAFNFPDIGGLTIIGIPTGFYSPTTLAAAILAWSTGSFGEPLTGFTATVNANGVITFGYGSTFSILTPGVASGQPTSRFISSIIYARSYQTSGTIPGTATLITGGTYAIVGTVPTMLPTRYINIESSYLTKFQRVKDSSTLQSGQSTNILCRVNAFAPSTRTTWPPADPESPFVVCIDYATTKLIAWNPDEVVSNFDILLSDEFGTLVPWDPTYGCEYSFTIIASET